VLRKLREKVLRKAFKQKGNLLGKKAPETPKGLKGLESSKSLKVI